MASADHAEPPAVPEPGAPSVQLPEWLARLRAIQPEEEQPVTQPSPLAEEAPEWIKQLRAVTPEEELPPVREGAPEPEEGEPIWLKGLREGEASSGQGLAAQAPQGEEASWIQRLRERAAEEPETPGAPAEEPEWIKQGRTEPTEPPAVSRSETHEIPSEEQPEVRVDQAAPAVGNVPSWVEQLQEKAAQAPEEIIELDRAGPEGPSPAVAGKPLAGPQSELAAPTVQEEEEIPDWLRKLRAKPLEAEIQEEESAAVEPELIPQAPTEVGPVKAKATPPEGPDWLTSEAVGAEAVEKGEIPEWLRLAMPAEPSAGEPAEPTDRRKSVMGEPGKAEPASEVKLAETIPAPSVPAGSGIDVTGPLAGLRGVLPLAVAITEPHVKISPSVAERASGAHILEALLAEPIAETEGAVPLKARRAWTMRPLIYLVLFLAVVIPFAIPTDLAESTLPISHTPAAEFYDVVQSLSANSTVVVAFDYDPSQAGEMDLLANAIVDDLVRRRIKIIAVSTLETGPQLAQGILDRAAASATNYQYGSDFVNIYLAGHEAGLADLAAAGWPTNAKDYVDGRAAADFAMVAHVRTLRDTGLVILLEGSEETLRMWMEQVQPRTQARFAAATSAAVDPQARAYRNANQLVATVGGLAGAAQYEVLSNQPGLAVTSFNAQSLGQLALVLVIVAGNLVYWVRRERGKAA